MACYNNQMQPAGMGSFFVIHQPRLDIRATVLPYEWICYNVCFVMKSLDISRMCFGHFMSTCLQLFIYLSICMCLSLSLSKKIEPWPLSYMHLKMLKHKHSMIEYSRMHSEEDKNEIWRGSSRWAWRIHAHGLKRGKPISYKGPLWINTTRK